MYDQIEQSGEEENIKVCQGLTDEERREIRKSQRVLRKEIPDLDVEDARERNNAIHKNVRYIRESVLDAENLDEIAKKAANNVDRLIQVRLLSGSTFDADLIVIHSCCYQFYL